MSHRAPGLGLGVVVLVLAVVATGCQLVRNPGPTLGPAPSVVRATQPPRAAVLVGAGDIATCERDTDEATARLLDAIDGTVFTAGDNVYERGRPEEFARCYDPTWGRHRERTLPVPGNHDYDTEGGAGYLAYFGEAARPEGTTWYATDVGEWRVIALDSNCAAVAAACSEDGEQVAWLRNELVERARRCTLAIWHHPTFSSGTHGGEPRTRLFWSLLDDAGAELVLGGHDHDYERFAPQDAEGRATEDGLRQFVVGTGGIDLRRFRNPAPNSEVRNSETHGVLRLTLRPDSYDWSFVPIAGGQFTDSGSGDCR